MNGNSVINVGVEAGGTQVVAHAGVHALGRFGDRVGLGSSLSTAFAWTGERAPTHDRGTVLTHAMLMLAGGGEACSDIEFLLSHGRCSVRWRRTRRCIERSGGSPRSCSPMCNRRGGAPVDVAAHGRDDRQEAGGDIDASLAEIHSENEEGTRPT